MTTIGNIAATAPVTGVKADIAKTAQQFEAIFLRQMIGSMRAASLADGITDTSESDQFRDMADSRTADSMAQTGSFGIAELLMRQFGAKPAVAPTAVSRHTGPKDDSQ